MKIETVVDALLDSHYKLIHHWNEQGHDKRYRQRDAFREGIIRRDERNRMEINHMKARLFGGIHQRCADKRNTKYIYPHIYCSLCGELFTRDADDSTTDAG